MLRSSTVRPGSRAAQWSTQSALSRSASSWLLEVILLWTRWSGLSLRGPGEERVIYSWAEKTVGTREEAGAWGRLDPSPMVQGAIEDSLRGLLKDLDSRGVRSEEHTSELQS